MAEERVSPVENRDFVKMQRVLQRTKQAKAQAARRALKRSQKNASDIRRRTKQTESVIGQSISDDIRQARIVRQENRRYGPLAPRRDVGDAKDTYGAMPLRRLQGFIKPPEERVNAQPIVADDRVVVVQGRDKGRIGTVVSVDKERHECTVQGLNLVGPTD